MTLRFLSASIVAGLIIWMTSLAWAQAPSSQVTASIVANGDVWVGQKVTLAIDLMAPGYFSGVPRFDYPTISGVLLVPPEGHPVVSTKQIEGRSFTVQHYEWLLFAKLPGSHPIPSFKIRFDIKYSPLDTVPASQEVMTPELAFTAKFPPGAENLTSLISARDLVVEEKWHPLPQTCKVGDAFTRTITYTATDIPGMVFPAFPAQNIEGVGVYPKTPVISDQSDRGELKGKREDTITYVCQRPGHFVIPVAQLTWWNIDERALHTIKLPGETFDVAPNPAFGDRYNREKLHFGSYAKWGGGIALLMLIFMASCKWIPWNSCRKALNFLHPIRLKPLNPSQLDH